MGSAGSNRVATYIAAAYDELSLRGVFQTGCSAGSVCTYSYLQPFATPAGPRAKNIAAIIPGTDSVLRNEYVVIGAHYDHIGRAAALSLDPENRDAIRPGADDNASGTAAVLELARRFAARPTRRSIIVVHFDAEEVGLVGSALFVTAPPVPRRKIQLMLNLDMVGRLSRNGLETDKSTLMYDDPPLLAVLDSAARSLRIAHSFTKSITGRSDHESFRRGDISAIAFFTGFHNDYHRASDTVYKLDVRGIGLISDVAEAVVRFAANR